VERIRKGNAALRRGDWDTVAANMDQDILLRTIPQWPEQRIYGRQAALAFYRSLTESGGPDVRLEEVIDLGDRVLTRIRWSFHGHESGIEAEQSYSVVTTWRDGLVILEEFFIDHADALKALGLEE
jgi:ketosteroid isomerase-like protein